MKNQSQLISQSNALTKARYKLDLVEKRCLYIIFQQVRKYYVEDSTQKNLFENMQIIIPRRDLDCITQDKRKNAWLSLRNLRIREFYEEKDDDNAISVGFIDWAKRDGKNYIVQVSAELLPYIVRLVSHFTTYDITFAMCLRSTYTQRFYELCCQYRSKGFFFLDVEDMRKMLCLENKYKNLAHLKLKVIEIARKELYELYETGECDLYFTFWEDEKTKIGKQVTRFWFKISSLTPKIKK